MMLGLIWCGFVMGIFESGRGCGEFLLYEVQGWLGRSDVGQDSVP